MPAVCDGAGQCARVHANRRSNGDACFLADPTDTVHASITPLLVNSLSGDFIMKTRIALAAAALILASAVTTSRAADPTSASPAVVSHIKVLSDKVEDISSLEAWKKSFIRDGMTEQQKALAVWPTVVKFRQQTSPPNEYLASSANVHDPIKDFNVYGYGMCCCASANIEALSRYAGLEARGWGINHHSVPEVKIDGHWSLLDASLIQYFN